MGKNLIQQARGKGGPTYRAPSFRYKGASKYIKCAVAEKRNGAVLDIVHCPGHSAPLVLMKYEEDNSYTYLVAPEGIKVGDNLSIGQESEVLIGNTLALKDIPDGTLIFNIESQPGDGGKFCRSTGTFAKVIGKQGNTIMVMLPSKKKKTFHKDCLATIGIVAGSGRKEKPILKAGKKMHYMRAKNKLYPIISGCAQNAVDHPFGNKRSSRKAKNKPAPRFAPPGRKVGQIRARRTGQGKR